MVLIDIWKSFAAPKLIFRSRRPGTRPVKRLRIILRLRRHPGRNRLLQVVEKKLGNLMWMRPKLDMRREKVNKVETNLISEQFGK